MPPEYLVIALRLLAPGRGIDSLLKKACVVLMLLTMVGSPLHADRYHYDPPGRLVRVIYEDLSSIQYTYDPNGNVTAVAVDPAGIPGDADRDGDVDGDDVNLILQITLDGGEPYEATADCNLDDVVDVLDIVCAIGASAPLPTGSPQLALPDLDAMRGDAVQAPVALSGVSGVGTALQLDLLFDTAVAAPGAVAPGGALADHVVATAAPATGVLRMVIYSPTNTAMASGDVAEVPFTVDAAAPFGMSPLTLGAAQVAGPDATALTPLTLFDGEIHVFAAEADLAITKSADRTVVANGDLLTYTVVADNTGPDGVTGAAVTDLVPGDLGGVNWTCAAEGGATCTASGIGDVVDAVDLPAGGSVTYTIEGTVDTGDLSFDNSAEVAAPPEALDDTPANDSATVTVLVCGGAANDTVPNHDVTTTELYSAVDTLTAADVDVLSGGDLTLRACGMVILESGFSVQGGRLTVQGRSP